MAEKVDFKSLFKNELNPTHESHTENKIENPIDDKVVESSDSSFTIIKQKNPVKKPFQMYMTMEKLKILDKICKKTGCNRTELINQMVDYCIDELNNKK